MRLRMTEACAQPRSLSFRIETLPPNGCVHSWGQNPGCNAPGWHVTGLCCAGLLLGFQSASPALRRAGLRESLPASTALRPSSSRRSTGAGVLSRHVFPSVQAARDATAPETAPAHEKNSSHQGQFLQQWSGARPATVQPRGSRLFHQRAAACLVRHHSLQGSPQGLVRRPAIDMGKGFFKLRQVGIDQISLLDRHVLTFPP